MPRTKVIDRSIDPVFVDARLDGHVEIRIGRPIGEGGVVPSLLARGSSLAAVLTPDEARTLASSLIAAADQAATVH